jgi:hypothetical protein
LKRIERVLNITFLALGLGIATTIAGGGKWSVDKLKNE